MLQPNQDPQAPPTPARSPPANPPPVVRVRAADLEAPADGAALLALLDAYARDPLGDGRPLDPAARACLVPALRRVPGALTLLALIAPGVAPGVGDAPGVPTATDARAVGVLVGFSGFSTFRARGLINVHDLYVLPAWRRRGVATRLLGALEAIARERGDCKLTLEVRADHAAARALYARLGYGAGQSAGQPVQFLFCEKRLADDG